MAIFIQSGETANMSEYLFFEYLQKALPFSWIIIGNAELVEAHKTSSEVDAVIIGGGNVWALEAKCWAGPISGDTHTWRWGGSTGTQNECKSPVLVIQNKARILATFIKKCNINTFVNGYVVLLANPPNVLKINSPDIQSSVFFKNDIVQALIKNSKTIEIEPLKLRSLIKKIGGDAAEKSYTLGGVKPSKPNREKQKSIDLTMKPNDNEQPDEYVITFSQPECDFSRVYYNSEYKKILLGKSELRGSSPDIWKNWKYEGIYLYLLKNGFSIECLPGSECILNNMVVPVGLTMNLKKDVGTITICGVNIEYKYEKYKGGT
jgi:hypothetical protein